MTASVILVDAARPTVITGGLKLLPDGRLAIRHGSCVDIIRPADIVSIHARKNMTRVATVDTSIQAYVSFGDVVEMVRAFGVFRIHRGIAVNSAHIRRVVGLGRHRVGVVLNNGIEFKVGRAFQSALRLHLGIALPENAVAARR
jgi:DNA-binding LytR/AlgR family response regulator